MMGTRQDSDPTPVEDDDPNLCFRVFGKEYFFPCQKCMEFWKHVDPADVDPHNNNSTCKPATSIKNHFERRYRICERERSKWNQCWKLLKHTMEVKNEEESVCVVRFIRLVRWFGCLGLNRRGSCFCIDEIFRLLETGGTMHNGLYTSWFAGIMKQDEAHRRILNQQPGTYLVRFSEGHADDGWFSVAIKSENGGVKHVQIKNDPEQACRGNGDESDGRFQLCSESDNERIFPNLVILLDERLSLDDIDGHSCDHICPDLPLNSTFQGYDR